MTDKPKVVELPSEQMQRRADVVKMLEAILVEAKEGKFDSGIFLGELVKEPLLSWWETGINDVYRFIGMLRAVEDRVLLRLRDQDIGAPDGRG